MRTKDHLAVGSPTVRVAAIMLATLLLAVALAAAGVAGQQLLAAEDEPDIIVAADGGGDYETISEAVAAAEDGDDILIRAGTYAEAVGVDKDITLRGDDRDTVVIEAPPDSAFGLRLAGRTAAVRDLGIRGPQMGAAIVVGGGAPIIERVTVQPGTETSLQHDRGDAVFREVDLHGRSEIRGSTPVIEDSRLWCGATVSTDAVFRRVAFLDGPECPSELDAIEYGIQVDFASPSIIDSVIEMPGDALEIYGSDAEPIVEGNTFRATATAIGTFQGAQPRIRDNVFVDNDVAMSLSADAVVEGNTVTGDGAGVFVRDGAPMLTGNTIDGVGGWAVTIEGDSAPILRDNVLCGFDESILVADTATADMDASNQVCDPSAD